LKLIKNEININILCQLQKELVEMQTLKKMTEEIVTFHSHFLDCNLIQNSQANMLYRLGDEAIPGLKKYLTQQVVLEKNLVKSLLIYWNNKNRLEKKYRSILASRTEPQYLGSNLIANKLSDCIKKMEENHLIFVKKWRNDPSNFLDYYKPRKGPETNGVDMALKIFEMIGNPKIIPFLLELIDHEKEIKKNNLLTSYQSVFKSAKKTLQNLKIDLVSNRWKNELSK
jgi:hypothetical protein